jgi:DNA invertase Pin-like site-specific DNA recombinase
MIMRIAYARTSTEEQIAGIEAQVRDLSASGYDKLFQEHVSSVAKRPQLESAIDYLRDGDTLVVCKLDRLARSTQNLLDIVERVKARGASLVVLNLAVDTGTATGELVFTVIGAIAAFERQLMLERQREGIAAAKAAGKYKGRKPTARAKSSEVLALKAKGIGASEIARQLGIHRASVHRILKP